MASFEVNDREEFFDKSEPEYEKGKKINILDIIDTEQ